MAGILSIDIGGTGLKASVLDDAGNMLVDRVRIPTPDPCPPNVMLDALAQLVAPLPPSDRVAVGFPGVVRDGKVLTAPHFDTNQWVGFELAAKLSVCLGGKRVRLINDAEMQGLAVITGGGIEMILTLGTGAGTGLFQNGKLAPHLELAHHPVHKSKNYNDYIGNAARVQAGNKRWTGRVLKIVDILDSLVNYDRLYLGGGNATHLKADLPPNVVRVSNDAGIKGGAALWRQPM